VIWKNDKGGIIMKDIILLCGKSGSGKDYLVKTFNMKAVVTHTTRQKRDYEIDGVHKWFHNSRTGNITWKRLYKDKKIIEISKRGSQFYWTHANDLRFGNVCIMDIQGLMQVLSNNTIKNKYKFTIVYIDCPICKRIKNMKKRGEKVVDIISRLWIDYKQFKPIKNIEKIVIKM
jgi:guanylate kinase